MSLDKNDPMIPDNKFKCVFHTHLDDCSLSYTSLFFVVH